MKIDTFIQLINNLQKGQLTDDEDPNNTVIQMYTSPYDEVGNDESIRIIKSVPSSCVWGDGKTYSAVDMQGNAWNAPSCGWMWGSGGRWDGADSTALTFAVQ